MPHEREFWDWYSNPAPHMSGYIPDMFDCSIRSRQYEALIEVGDGSQWTVSGSSIDDLKSKAQDVIGKDLTHERYYVRHVYVDGVFDDHATQELQTILRA